MPDFPHSAPVKQIQQQHPDYAFFQEVWEQIGTLYEGGAKMRAAVIESGQFLIKNTKELPEVFATRQLRFSYTNLLGNVIGWYMSALFKQPPQLLKRQRGVSGEKALQTPQAVTDFASDFEKDCDRGGTSYNEFWRKVAEALLLYRKAYILLDLPAPTSMAGEPVSLQQQKDQGLLDPFLVLYTPRNVINWGSDAYGNLEWATIYIRVQEQRFLDNTRIVDYWYYFDREQVALYEHEVTKDTVATNGGGEEMATLVEGYPRPHALTDQGRVPLFEVELQEGLWLANRVFLPLINHLNQDNALDFGLMQANLPQLVIEDGDNGTYEEPVTISAVGYHHLPHNAKMYFLEPEGRAYVAAQHRIDALEERIYKACYLTDQARTNKSTPAAQSGISKEADKTPSRDALSGVGDVIRPAQQAVYAAVLQLAGFPDIDPDVRGYDFADRATAADMALLEQATVVPVNSETFERELGKKNVRASLPDLNPEQLQKIDDEIDANPTPSVVDQQLQEQQQQAMVDKFKASMDANVPSS